MNGYTNVIISTLERRFRLQSFQTGLIVVSYDFAYFLLCLFVTFYGNRGHRPKMLAISSMLFGLGCLLFCIPHFTTGNYQYGGNYSGEKLFNEIAVAIFPISFHVSLTSTSQMTFAVLYSGNIEIYYRLPKNHFVFKIFAIRSMISRHVHPHSRMKTI